MTMKTRRGFQALILALLIAIASASAALAGSSPSVVTVVNNSRWTIKRIYISSTYSRIWGPDQLGTYVLLPGYEIRLNFRCGTYDVKLVDEDNDTCILPKMDICGDRNRWQIEDLSLLLCEGLEAGN